MSSQLPEWKYGTVHASLELLYRISREFAGALDLSTVLQRVVSLSIQTVGATSGTLIVLDDHGLPVDSVIITGSRVHQHTTQRLKVPLERGLAGWVAKERQAALISNTNRDSRWIERKYVGEEQRGPKSAMSAPLLAREMLVGVITLVHPTPGYFGSDHLALLQAIADQAAISVFNARLYGESQRQARVMSALAESSAAISASLDIEEVLGRILDPVGQALQVQAVALGLIDPEKDEIVFRATLGWARRKGAKRTVRLGQGITGWVAKEGKGVVLSDARNDPRFDAETDQRTGFETRAVAGAPVRYRGNVIGVLEAINPLGEGFNADALLVLTGIGSLAGSAIYHAQLFENLQQTHRSYKELFEDSIDPILITDEAGKVLESNRRAAEMINAGKEDLMGMDIRKLHTIDEGRIGLNFEKLALTGASSPGSLDEPESTGIESPTKDGAITYESCLHTLAGKEIPVQVYVRKVKLESKTHIQWILRDISEHKRLETQREELLSMIYHDLRSPLANVVSSLDVLNSIASDDPSQQALLKIATRSTERIQRLTNSLLDINRLEAGQPVDDRQPVETASLVEEAVEVVFPNAEAKGQAFQVQIPEALPAVWIEADMIRRVLINLLENAVKFSPLGGEIQVGVATEGDWVRIWVKDNGPGIDRGDQEHIFEKFTRVVGKDLPKGIGLGLAFCQLAVKGHGGRIWVESEPGEGATFTFLLPALPSKTETAT